MTARTIELALSPLDAMSRWPSDRPVAILSSGAPGKWSRWSILAEPSATITWRRRGESFVVDASGWKLSADRAWGGDPIGDVEALTCQSARATDSLGHDCPPFAGGWIGSLSYDLGSLIEPRARGKVLRGDERAWPAIVMHRCDAAYVHDAWSGRWWAVGEGLGRLPRLSEASVGERSFAVGRPISASGRDRYIAAVERARRYILDGDVYQVNIAHRLTSAFRGSARSAFRSMVSTSQAWYGGFIEHPDRHATRRCFASASPELFLEYRARDRMVTTRPMKGTRDVNTDPGELEHSVKDRAELAMIVDLMRNDLGRVSEVGSVRVGEERVIEKHGGGVWQGSATVSGTLRSGAGLADLLRATFPGGSVTGAPKIRAMQIIDELEPVARGPYCGAFGYFSDCGNAALAMSIRTGLITGAPDVTDGALDEISEGLIDFSVGAGIVADSDPRKEWEETLTKATVLSRLVTTTGTNTTDARVLA